MSDFIIPAIDTYYEGDPTRYAAAFEDPSTSSEEEYGIHDLYAEMYGFNFS